jgi:hypothetical protein
MPLTPQSRVYEDKLARNRKKYESRNAFANERSKKAQEQFSSAAPKESLRNYTSLKPVNTEFADSNLISFVEPFAKVLAGTVSGGLNAASKGQEMAYKSLGVPRGFGVSETLIPRNENADNTILSKILSALPVSNDAKEKAKKSFTSDASWSDLPFAALNAIPGGGPGGAAIGSVKKTGGTSLFKSVDRTLQQQREALAKKSSEALLEGRSLTDRMLDEITQSAPISNASRVPIYDFQEMRSILRGLNLPEDVIDPNIERGISSRLRNGTFLRFSENIPSINLPIGDDLLKRVDTTMRGGVKGRLADDSILKRLIEEGSVARQLPQNAGNYWDQLTGVQRAFTGGRMMPSSIATVRDGKAVPQQWQADHAPWGVSWLDEAAKTLQNKSGKMPKQVEEDVASGFNWLLNESGVLIPRAANIGLGSLPRAGENSIGWQRLQKLFPGMSDSLYQRGLMDTYNNMDAELQKVAPMLYEAALKLEKNKDVVNRYVDKSNKFLGNTFGF